MKTNGVMTSIKPPYSYIKIANKPIKHVELIVLNFASVNYDLFVIGTENLARLRCQISGDDTRVDTGDVDSSF